MELPVNPPILPMLAKRVSELPTGGSWMFEPKWDGFRALVFRDGDEIFIQSRDEKPLGRYFPEVLDPLLSQLPKRCVLDGEIVIAKDGALDFDALQLRLHPAASRVKLLSHQFPEGCMSTSRQTRTVLVEPTTTEAQGCLCTKSEPLGTDPVLNILTGERLLAAQAMQLLIQLDRDLREARAQFNEDWFRRIMWVRPKAVSRLRRRWTKLSLPPAIPLGSLRRACNPLRLIFVMSCMMEIR